MSDTTLYATSRETPVDEDSFIDEIRNDEKNINSEIFDEYFRYQIHHFQQKIWLKPISLKLRKSIIKKEVPKNEKPNKIIDIVKKILDLNNPEKGTGLKIITPKQILHRLPILHK